MPATGLIRVLVRFQWLKGLRQFSTVIQGSLSNEWKGTSFEFSSLRNISHNT